MEETMNGLDELLADAALRLDDATGHLPIPRPPSPSFPAGRVALRLACVLAIAGGVYVVAQRRNAPTAAEIPPGFVEGRYGQEITITEIDDGDNNNATYTLLATPGGGFVKVAPANGSTPTTIAAIPVAVVSNPTAAAPADPSTQVCVSGTEDGVTGGAGSLCGDPAQPPQVLLSNRGEQGQALVYGLPPKTVAVAFAAGSARYWAQPLHGIAAFPYPSSAATTATFQAFNAAGQVIAGDQSSNDTLTQAEVEAAVVTRQTADALPGSWFGDVPLGMGYGAETVRLHGRTALTGFQGPFAVQGYVPDPARPRDWVFVTTLRSADASAVRQRLEGIAGGSIRSTLDVADGVQVLVWASDSVGSKEIDRLGPTIRERAPLADRAVDLDIPRAFQSENAFYSGGVPVLEALRTDAVATVNGHHVLAEADDIGEITFSVAGDDPSSTLVGPHLPPRAPVAGGSTFAGLWAVPADIGQITLTLDDGTVLTPEVIDVRPLVNAKLLYLSHDHPAGTIARVDTQPG
jgi:hypothetical protein